MSIDRKIWASLDQPVKICTRCDVLRLHNQFRKEPRMRDGRRSWCIPCDRSRHREYLRLTKPWKTNKLYYKNAKWKCRYGIDVNEVETMFVKQQGTCAICNREFTILRDLQVDHDHSTGQVRELLCQKCNTGIGYFQEDITVLSRAIDYLIKWGVK